jgi:hypothetical protein
MFMAGSPENKIQKENGVALRPGSQGTRTQRTPLSENKSRKSDCGRDAIAPADES